jgi:hypothetical protein
MPSWDLCHGPEYGIRVTWSIGRWGARALPSYNPLNIPQPLRKLPRTFVVAEECVVQDLRKPRGFFYGGGLLHLVCGAVTLVTSHTSARRVFNHRHFMLILVLILVFGLVVYFLFLCVILCVMKTSPSAGKWFKLYRSAYLQTLAIRLKITSSSSAQTTHSICLNCRYFNIS